MNLNYLFYCCQSLSLSSILSQRHRQEFKYERILLHVLFYRSLLRNSEIQRDPKQYEQAVQKVIAYMTLGIDVSSLFSEMIMVRCICTLCNDITSINLPPDH